MSSFWLDCGVLSCPSKSRLSDGSSTVTPKLSTASFYQTERGTSLSSSTLPSPRPSSHPRAVLRRRGGPINRGVGHGIKKPKLKAKDKKASNPAKVSVRRLKQVKPPPRLAEHRSPALSAINGKKRHRLSSPGMSLLENADSHAEATSPGKGGKFFTSRARAAATVQITKNVMLSASYGNISLQQRNTSSGLKKNIGGTLTENIKSPFKDSTNKVKEPFNNRALPFLGQVENTNKPKPTRFPSTPSPHKRTLASLKAKQLYTDKENQSCSEVRNGVRSSPRRKSLLPSNYSLLSPSKFNELSVKSPHTPKTLKDVAVEMSPSKRKRSPSRECITTPVRSSSRRVASTTSPRTTPSKTNHTNLKTTPNKTISSNGDSRIISPRTALLKKSTPIKTTNILTRSSPGKLMPCSIAERNVVIEMVHQSPNAKTCVTPIKRNSQSYSTTSPSLGSTASPRRLMLRNSPLRRNIPSPSSERTTPSKSCPTEQRDSDQNSLSLQDSQELDTSIDGVRYFSIFDPEKRKSHHNTDNEQKSARISGRFGGMRAATGDMEQRMLDAGQKEFGARSCDECGLVYEAGDPDDDRLHEQHHNRVMAALTYTNWKKERQISTVDSRGGRCILISSSDPQYCWRKVCDVLAVVDEELGFSDNCGVTRGAMWVVLYVVGNSVVGCLVAEPVNTAFRVVPSKTGNDDTDGNVAPESELLCCSTDGEPVKYGISRIWVRSDNRRVGLASRLVDSFRGNVVAYHYLKIDEFAFSDPTPSGMRFARSYTKKADFLVYRHGA